LVRKKQAKMGLGSRLRKKPAIREVPGTQELGVQHQKIFGGRSVNKSRTTVREPFEKEDRYVQNRTRAAALASATRHQKKHRPELLSCLS